MADPTIRELSESIKELTAYRNRLAQEVTNIAQKLRMPQRKIDSSLKENPELREINQALSKLISFKKRQESLDGKKLT